MDVLVTLLILGVLLTAIVLKSKKKGSPMLSRSEFASNFAAAAAGVDMRGIPVQMALSVSALETGWGTGSVFLHTNNLFSITATPSWRGERFQVKATGYTFRVYPSWRDAIRDWVGLISGAKLYAVAYAAALAGDYKGFFAALQRAGYAGPDTAYASKLTRTYEALA